MRQNSELSPSQTTTTIQRILYLKQAYLDMLTLQSSKKLHFKQCCEQAIKKCHKFDFKMINSPKVLMKLNRYFRDKETLPHPNIIIELGQKFNSIFFRIIHIISDKDETMYNEKFVQNILQ